VCAPDASRLIWPHKAAQMKRLIAEQINRCLLPLGARIVPKWQLTAAEVDDGKSGGFPGYLREAEKIGMDVNDYLEQVFGWGDPRSSLERTTFPYLRPDSIVCEIGPGTGRFSRQIAARLNQGKLHLVDHSSWLVGFLQRYFHSNKNVHVHLGDGCSLQFNDCEIDLVCSFGTLTAFKLGQFYACSREFFRVLRPGDYGIIDYLNISDPGAWDHLETNFKCRLHDCYTYHTPEVVESVFSSAGFTIVGNDRNFDSYLVLRKPPNG
jgi:ubiquinone/menaquinone biosynthesis C-methylase UbiE